MTELEELQNQAGAINAIADLAERANKPELIETFRGEDSRLRRFYMPDGQITEVELKPGDRQFKLHKLADLIAMANNHFDKAVGEENRMVIFYDLKSCILFFDYKECREFAYVNFSISDAMGWLEKFSEMTGSTISPKEFRTILKTTFIGCQFDLSLIDKISKLETYAKSQQHAQAGRTGESLGTSITSQVEEGIQLPDEFNQFVVPFFGDEELDYHCSLNVFIEPDTSSNQWLVKVTEQSWRLASYSALLFLESMIKNGLDSGVEVPFYAGFKK